MRNESMTDVKVPTLGESITEATLGEWLKKPGEAVAADEPIASLETDKVSVEVPSPVAGVLTEQLVGEGDTVAVGAVIARIDQSAMAGAAAAPSPSQAAAASTTNPAGPGAAGESSGTGSEGSASWAPAFAGERRGTQGRARQDVAHPADDRQAPQGGTEHRRHADDVQRRRHERGDRRAHPLQGSVREE